MRRAEDVEGSVLASPAGAWNAAACPGMLPHPRETDTGGTYRFVRTGAKPRRQRRAVS